jgi:hypothetical protein
MVAMFGRIMPAPFEMPVIAISRPPILNLPDAALATVSVVMIASAALAQSFARRCSRQYGKAATMRSTGSCSMMTPVENGRICCGEQPISFASASHVARAAASPASPVPALALPVFTTSARICAPCARCSRQTITGAAQKRFFVKTPATCEPSASFITSTSLRFALRTPASAMPSSTPAMG